MPKIGDLIPQGHNPENLPLEEGYRWVGIDEKIQAGDQIFVEFRGRWLDSQDISYRRSGWSYRRKIEQPKQSMKHIIISVHNHAISRAIQATLVAFKWGWSATGYNYKSATGYNYNSAVVDSYKGSHNQTPAIRVSLMGATKKLEYGYREWYVNQPEFIDAVYLDGKTDLGKLIEILEQKQEPEAPELYGHKAKYKKNYSSIEFGCAKISIPMLRAAYGLMTADWLDVNRKVQFVALDSGKTLRADEIKPILDFIDQVNAI